MEKQSEGTKGTRTQQGRRLAMCACGHTGNREDSFHGPRFDEGHGACLAPGCACRQFTWIASATAKQEAANKKAVCYYLIETDRDADGRRLIVRVRRDVGGYQPTAMRGAQAQVDALNGEHGLTERDVFAIVASSMRAS